VLEEHRNEIRNRLTDISGRVRFALIQGIFRYGWTGSLSPASLNSLIQTNIPIFRRSKDVRLNSNRGLPAPAELLKFEILVLPIYAYLVLTTVFIKVIFFTKACHGIAEGDDGSSLRSPFDRLRAG
jgi:hypothetical protein